MAVGRAAVLTAAIFGAAIFGAGVHSNQSSNRSTEAPTAPSISGPESMSRPELMKHLKPLVADDAQLTSLGAGFQSVEDFGAALHAAKNIRVPFDVLKHEVVDGGRSLSDAIHSVKPSADALLEADLARSEARSDLTAIK